MQVRCSFVERRDCLFDGDRLALAGSFVRRRGCDDLPNAFAEVALRLVLPADYDALPAVQHTAPALPAVAHRALIDPNPFDALTTEKWTTFGPMTGPDGLSGCFYSGADRGRTDDLLNAIQALSQLSYGPGAARARGAEPGR